MKSYHGLLLVLAFGLGILVAIPSPAADPVSKEQINKLIEKMGSGDFEDREKATEELDAIGVPALEALRKAVKSDDAEVRRRSEELVTKIEKRLESVRVLAPTKINLNYKDTPVAEAVKDFAKKSGYPISVLDPKGALKDRKISLNTGEVPFWQAFDLLCKEAGLVEATANDVQRLMPQPQPIPNPFGQPPGVVVPPIPVPPGKPAVLPVPPGKPLPPDRAPLPNRLPVNPVDGQTTPPMPPVKVPVPKQLPAKPVEELPPQRIPGKDPELQVEQAPAQQGVPAIAIAQVQAVQVQVRPAILPVQPPQAGFIGGIGGPVMPFPGMGQPNQITLIDGKAKAEATDFSSAVRVRASDHVKQQPRGAESDLRLGLQLTPEPKLQWQQVLSVRVEKAIDDQDQKLAQVMDVAPNPNQPGQIQIGFGGFPAPGIGFGGNFGGFQGVGFGAMSHYTEYRLKKGEKACKTLKEVSGVITAQILVPTQAITVDNLMKMANKEVKGKDGGLIKILEAKKSDNDQVTVRFEFDGAGNAGNPFGGIAVPGIQIQPLPVPPQIQPLPPNKLPLRKQLQVQPAQPQPAQDVPLPAKVLPAQVLPAQPAIARPPIQIQIAPAPPFGGPGGFIGMPAGNTGFTLVDDKGNVLQAIGFNQQFRQNGNVFKMEQVLTFQLQKGNEAAKLVYSTSKVTTIDVPFTLKNVTIP